MKHLAYRFSYLQAKVIDLIHAAAYEAGLGNSLFVEESRIGKLGYEDVSNNLLRSFYLRFLHLMNFF